MSEHAPSSTLVDHRMGDDHEHGGQHPMSVGHGGVCKPLQPVWLSWLPLLVCGALVSLAILLAPGVEAGRGRARVNS